MAITDYTDFVHVGSSTLAGRYLRRFWHPVYRSQYLAPGQAMPIRIMGEDFTLYRGESGKPYVVDYRCAHRQTQLSVGWVEEDCIRCFYHGWKYDGTGQCVEQPGEEKRAASKVRIKSYPVEEYLGLIFTYIGEGAPPPLARYPECEGEGILEVFSTETWPCNYFSQLDNAGDPIHVPFVHRESRRRVKIETPISKIYPKETDIGIQYTMISSAGKKHLRYLFMPNIVQVDVPLRQYGFLLDDSPSGGAMMPRLIWKVPVDDENFVSFGLTYIPLTGSTAEKFQEHVRQTRSGGGASVGELGRAVLAGKLRIRDIEAMDNYKLIQVEDYVAQVGQGAVPDHSKDSLCRNDLAVVLLRKIWERELRCLVEGRGIKQWSRSEHFDMMAQD
jgi:5,5'-dehydrodivanillate O-demethylase